MHPFFGFGIALVGAGSKKQSTQKNGFVSQPFHYSVFITLQQVDSVFFKLLLLRRPVWAADQHRTEDIAHWKVCDVFGWHILQILEPSFLFISQSGDDNGVTNLNIEP